MTINHNKGFVVSKHYFISYSHDDRAFVDSLAERLVEMDVVVWYDKHLTPGRQWSKELEDKIRTAKGLIVVLSLNSSRSEYLIRELHFAKDTARLRTIVPVLKEPCEMPLLLSGAQYIDFSSTPEDAIMRLHNSLTRTKQRRTNRPVETGSESTPIHLPRFHYGGVVPPEYFINREAELLDAEDLIRQNQSFLLVGSRRSGKTSFCNMLIHRVMGRPENNCLAGILNLDSLSNVTIETFLGHTIINMIGEIARQVFRCKWSDLGNHQTIVKRPELQQDDAYLALCEISRSVLERSHGDNSNAPSMLLRPQFVAMATDLIDIIKSRGWLHYAIFYDEANRLATHLSIEILTSHTEILNRAQLTTVYAVTPEIATSYLPLRDSLARYIQVGPFTSRRQMLQMLARYYHGDVGSNVPVPITQSALDLVWEQSAGLPFHLQMILGYSFANAHRSLASRVTETHVSDAMALLIKERPDYFPVR